MGWRVGAQTTTTTLDVCYRFRIDPNFSTSPLRVKNLFKINKCECFLWFFNYFLAYLTIYLATNVLFLFYYNLCFRSFVQTVCQ